MELISTILVAVFTSGVVSALVTTVLNWYIKSKELGEQRRWEIKREACLEALEIIDARFADYGWEVNGTRKEVDPQGFVSTAKIRSCFNRLVLACENSAVPQQFEECLHLRIGPNDPERLTMDTVVGLRNAIRKELGFGAGIETSITWIEYIKWRRSENKDTS